MLCREAVVLIVIASFKDVICSACGRNRTDTIGYLQAPVNANGFYLNNLHCTWIIETSIGSILVIQRVYFDLDKRWGGKCLDRLEITDGATGRLMLNRCGSQQSFVVRSSSNTAKIIFVSDGIQSNHTGFQIKWKSLKSSSKGAHLPSSTTALKPVVSSSPKYHSISSRTPQYTLLTRKTIRYICKTLLYHSSFATTSTAEERQQGRQVVTEANILSQEPITISTTDKDGLKRLTPRSPVDLSNSELDVSYDDSSTQLSTPFNQTPTSDFSYHFLRKITNRQGLPTEKPTVVTQKTEQGIVRDNTNVSLSPLRFTTKLMLQTNTRISQYSKQSRKGYEEANAVSTGNTKGQKMDQTSQEKNISTSEMIKISTLQNIENKDLNTRMYAGTMMKRASDDIDTWTKNYFTTFQADRASYSDQGKYGTVSFGATTIKTDIGLFSMFELTVALAAVGLLDVIVSCLEVLIVYHAVKDLCDSINDKEHSTLWEMKRIKKFHSDTYFLSTRKPFADSMSIVHVFLDHGIDSDDNVYHSLPRNPYNISKYIYE